MMAVVLKSVWFTECCLESVWQPFGLLLLATLDLSHI